MKNPIEAQSIIPRCHGNFRIQSQVSCTRETEVCFEKVLEYFWKDKLQDKLVCGLKRHFKTKFSVAKESFIERKRMFGTLEHLNSIRRCFVVFR